MLLIHLIVPRVNSEERRGIFGRLAHILFTLSSSSTNRFVVAERRKNITTEIKVFVTTLFKNVRAFFLPPCETESQSGNCCPETVVVGLFPLRGLKKSSPTLSPVVWKLLIYFSHFMYSISYIRGIRRQSSVLLPAPSRAPRLPFAVHYSVFS